MMLKQIFGSSDKRGVDLFGDHEKWEAGLYAVLVMVLV